MRVTLLYNQPVLPQIHEESASEHDILDSVAAVEKHLAEAGCQVVLLGVEQSLAKVLAPLQRQSSDVVFNLFEGFGDDPASEIELARLLEQACIPFTGCPSRALWLAGRKDLAKSRFQQAALPTADFLLVESLPVAHCPLPWPVFVKPAFRDASIGIDPASVATCPEQLRRRLEHLAQTVGLPVLVERFIPGREISVAVIDGPRALPPVEIIFDAGAAPIMTYDAKWSPQSPAYLVTRAQYPAQLSPRETARILDLAERAYSLLGCRHLATVDFRLDLEGNPHILEVNPNPNLKPTSCFLQALEAVGQSYEGFLLDMIHRPNV